MAINNQLNTASNNWKSIYHDFEKRIVLAFFIVLYYIKRPLYFNDPEINKFDYFISRTLTFIHFLFILFYHHFKPFSEYTMAILVEFYSVIILKEPSWKSENV